MTVSATGSVVHLAGSRVEICGRVLQRCLICGEKLRDSADDPAAGKVWPLSSYWTWMPGLWVRFEPEPMQHAYALGSSCKEAPSDDCCLALVER